eukprot:NODE_2856_length_1026_cov_196.144319_g2392_i0.p1 GENE.NODE_2856_length_1026_cov_196.144319_g2392_i0~~NODE_2856_length_1026_cov_196.144319_g2392_i0.p1  ORF type:complete len:263 (-),score=75.62 NODE_2856_length_1026_cov_196.144319_g2392_i0:101-889(-)
MAPALSLLVLVGALVAFGRGEDGPVAAPLEDKNFEDVTQAATGQTTGPWFVEFYAPWCGHCKNLAPTWDALAAKLHPEVHVAKVDVTENKELGTRFGIQGFPTLILLRDGKMYHHSGARELEELATFATEGYKTAESEPVPMPPGFAQMLYGFYEDFEGRFASYIMKHQEVALFLFISGGAAGVLLALIAFLGCWATGFIGGAQTIIHHPSSPAAQQNPAVQAAMAKAQAQAQAQAQAAQKAAPEKATSQASQRKKGNKSSE